MRGSHAITLAALILGISLVGCGGGDGGSSPEPVGRQTASDRADTLCRQYRARVTEVHFRGAGDAKVLAEMRRLTKQARKTFEDTREADLGEGGDRYLAQLDRLVPLYARATAAKEGGDQAGFQRAIRQAQEPDRRLDELTEEVGLEKCSLGAPMSDETRVSEAGFPSMVVPERAGDAKPMGGGASIAYPLSDREALLVSRGPKTRLGRTSQEYANFFFRRSSAAAARAKSLGKTGREPVPMHRFRYTGKGLNGMAYVYSGQGNLWVMLCATRGKKPSGQLTQACKRAASTTGFLMF